MSKRKGFLAKSQAVTPRIGMVPLDPIATTVPRLERLLEEILERKLSPRCYGLVKRFSHLEPAVRLSVNLKSILDSLAVKEVTNILSDGLSKAERQVLMEIDASDMSLESRRTAHTLFNLDTRRKLADVVVRVFRDTRTRKNHVLVDKPLD